MELEIKDFEIMVTTESLESWEDQGSDLSVQRLRCSIELSMFYRIWKDFQKYVKQLTKAV